MLFSSINKRNTILHIHLYLKFENLFLSDKMIFKIGDFDLATKLDYDGEEKHIICGTYNYVSPETLEGKYLYEIDIRAVGIIMYALLIGKFPFEYKDIKKTKINIRAYDYTFPEDAKISYHAK